MRETILREIRRLAEANSGRAHGKVQFENETNISEHQGRGKVWARWNDALAEAGCVPNKMNKRLDSDFNDTPRTSIQTIKLS